MLSGVHPLLTGALLAALDRMGHGDAVAVVDANFPAYRVGPAVVEVSGSDAPAVTRAIRTVFPLDTYEGPSVSLMRTETGDRSAVQDELVAVAATSGSRVEEVERFEFYARAAQAFIVVRTGERRPYGNVILRKGVVAADFGLREPA
jgi:L-fucose mutarotase